VCDGAIITAAVCKEEGIRDAMTIVALMIKQPIEREREGERERVERGERGESHSSRCEGLLSIRCHVEPAF
jgi:hypothetical protein